MPRKLEFKYKPHPKQARFHEACAEGGFVLFLAGIGAGKTLSGVHEIIYSALRNPGWDGLIGSPTFGMLRDVIMPLWREYVPKQLWKEYKKDQLIELWTGQRIYLRSAERPDSALGLNLGFAWEDEAAYCGDGIFDSVIRDRVGRVVGVPHPCIFYTTTPDGWNWITQKFYREKLPRHRVVKAITADNPFISPGFIEDRRSEMTDDRFRQQCMAEVIESTGLCWFVDYNIHAKFNRSGLFQARDVVEVVGGIDWGWSMPTAIEIAARTKDGHWYLIDEWYQRPNASRPMEDILAAMKEMNRKWRVKRWWADSAEPDRISEANANGFRVLPVKKRAGSLNQGIQEVASMLAVKRDGKPTLFISPDCKNFLNEAMYYHYDKLKDRPVGDRGDHACDAVRYMMYSENYDKTVRGFI